jgi:holliday junction DNA helicase RuvA
LSLLWHERKSEKEMIVHLTGTLLQKEPSHCVVDVGGVGYGVSVSLATYGVLPEAGQPVSLPIHTHVREDQLTLFGFASGLERSLFQKLIGVSGVGPKTALAILSGLPPSDLIEAIGGGDAARLCTIPGIGKKTAERMVVELRDALARDHKLTSSQARSEGAGLREDALSALVNLGYARPVAEKAIEKAKPGETTKVEEVIRGALKELCRA